MKQAYDKDGNKIQFAIEEGDYVVDVGAPYVTLSNGNKDGWISTCEEFSATLDLLTRTIKLDAALERLDQIERNPKGYADSILDVYGSRKMFLFYEDLETVLAAKISVE